MHFHWRFFMPSAIVLHQAGPPENLKFEPVTVQAPLPGQIRLRQTALGVNFHDTYVRSGLYQTLALPGIPGIEGVGIVTERGEGVRHLSVGDRVAYIQLGYGAYSEERTLPAQAAIRLPDGLDDRIVAATLLKGLTAQVLTHEVYAIKPLDWVLVHAATGGVGSLLTQWASHLRSEEHTSELQSLMRISYAVFCLKKKKNTNI